MRVELSEEKKEKPKPKPSVDEVSWTPDETQFEEILLGLDRTEKKKSKSEKKK